MNHTYFDFRKLSNFHLNALISSMDVPRKLIPKTKPKKIEMVIGLQASEPDRFDSVYNFVIRGQAPEIAHPEVEEDEIRAIVNKVVSEQLKSIDSFETALEAVVNKLGVDAVEKVISAGKAAVEAAAKKYQKIEVVSPKKNNIKMEYTMPEEFPDILERASMRLNVLLVGPSGCGKTFISEQISKALDLPFASISCSAGMSEAMLVGWLIPTGENGKFVYVSSQFVEKYENGGVFLLDELDAADPNTMVFINQALAQDHFFIAQRYENPLVKKHPDFICIAAANTFGNGADMMFVGRNQLDAATLDRFRSGMVSMDYSPVVEEATINPDVLAWGRGIRQAISQHKLRRVMSTRFMQDLTKMTDGCNWTKEKWESVYFSDWTPQERSKVAQPIQQEPIPF